MLGTITRVGGLTLLELMVTITVAAILLGVGIPGMGNLILDSRRTARVNDLVHAIHLARTESIKRVEDVVLCKSGEQRQCAGSETGWGEGWLVFVNLDRDQPAQVDEHEPILREWPSTPSLTVTANRNAFVFRSFSRRATNGTLTFCDRRGPSRARAVIVSYTGRPRIATEAPDGGPLECAE